MPIIETDINKFYLSGGATNSDVDVSIGGAVSNIQIASNSIHNVFDLVNSDEALNGSVEYRCFYIKNSHPSIILSSPRVWIETDLSGADISIDIGLGPSAINGVEQSVVNAYTAPSGVIFTKPISKPSGLSLGNLNPNATKAVWIRRTVNANSSAINNANIAIGFGGDTTA